MGKDCEWIYKIFSVHAAGFDALAMEIFHFQYLHNPIYKSYVQAIGVLPERVNTPDKIPFLPISFFKTHRVITSSAPPQLVFESSGTTGSINSRHFVAQKAIYEKSFITAFESFYGPVTDWCIIGLLPSYLERDNSSLVFMVNELIGRSNHADSGFYLNNYEQLYSVLQMLEQKGQKTLLIGVTFALLDFAAQYTLPLKHTVIMETGGMKGRRKEMIRKQVHDQLITSFSLHTVHSEYGMTELLSQAYSKGNGIFYCPSWMKVLARAEDDPLCLQPPHGNTGTKGALNVIDLANVYSCSFIATDDVGTVFNNGSFEVQGRMDTSDVRGCNLMIV